MMGPEAALVSERFAELRRVGGYVGALPLRSGPMYAEAAAQAYLEPPCHQPGAWARLRAALRSRGSVERDAPAWTVAAAPIVVKD